ncbi:MAG: 1-deoxy-D-xylulose-5-phosphate reductoisomerase, partial [Prolixibacteraceae bacterium]|nr:1-deoxy-D-xylulose-5-phosphate reductoisomerase [Prolixibacteraceae bacterium]
MKKRIAILGSTGSIGTQSLEVIEQRPDIFEVEVLTANNNVELLEAQIRKFVPNVAVIANEQKYLQLKERVSDLPVKIYGGAKAIEQVAQMETVDLVLAAMVGYSGLLPTLKAVEAGKNIALANKETLVVAGELITRAAREKQVAILPVDSEHSAIFQCLAGEWGNPVEKIILTCSGGPFRGKTKDFLQHVTPPDALVHPNWEMGAKITIDSATLMNKGLELIEAVWLFGLNPDQVEIVVHRESVVHSAVEFADGSVIAQLGVPDMTLPIQYALSYPKRLTSDVPRLRLTQYGRLTFYEPDYKTFDCLTACMAAIKAGGLAPAVANGANEQAVQLFLRDEIRFL